MNICSRCDRGLIGMTMTTMMKARAGMSSRLLTNRVDIATRLLRARVVTRASMSSGREASKVEAVADELARIAATTRRSESANGDRWLANSGDEEPRVPANHDGHEELSIPGVEDARVQEEGSDSSVARRNATTTTHTVSHRDVQRFRASVYEQGELDKSDLAKPPSWRNPHPFDPSTLPPTHSRSLTPYVNHLPLLRKLVDLGVDLFQIELTAPKLTRHLVRLDWEKDVRPKLLWMIEDVHVAVTDLGGYISRNPFFLIQDLDDMKIRVNYLITMKFSKAAIAKIIVTNRYWINNDVKLIDGRLGFLQRQFKLSDGEMRKLIEKEPRVLQFGLGPIQRLVQVFHNELQFSAVEMKHMLMDDPRLWMMNPAPIIASHAYLQDVVGFSNRRIAECPWCLRVPAGTIRLRHEFLRRMKRDQYEPDEPNYVSIALLLHRSDKEFATRAANTFVSVYNEYLRSR